jgi:serine/threonine-protein kinase
MDDSALLQERVGMTLKGKWTLEQLIGHGGMAAVYVGVHKIGRRHAIKILHPEVAASPEVRARFEQEAHAVNLLHHPGAVEIHDFDISEDGCPFLVMELLEGETLAQRLEREQQYDLGQLLSMADQTLEVLAVAHGEGIIHRDIKPANLFLLRDGTVKVLDFGVARMLEGTRAVHTRLGTALGTPTYMPPEQARGEAIDGRADLFALGGTLFRAITRQRIHPCETDADLLLRMATVPARPLSTVAPNVSQDVCLVVDRALAFHRDQRYPHARIMQVDVRALLDGRTPSYAAKRSVQDPLCREPEEGKSAAQATARTEQSGTLATHVDGPPTFSSSPPDPRDAPTWVSPSSTQPSTPPSGANSIADATRAETPLARGPSWPVPKTLTDIPSVPPSPMLAPTAPDGVLAPYPPSKPSGLWWIALLVFSVLALLVAGTLGGWWWLRSVELPSQMEAK